MNQPFPDEWSSFLQKNIHIYNHLPDNLKKHLHDYVKIFVAEKRFEGCGGLELTTEMKVTIAGQACMLLLNRKTNCYPKLHTILVYPSVYKARKAVLFEFQDEKSRDVRIGESWTTGNVVLAWDYVKKGAMDMGDGHNVVLHEFAHQLDQEDGVADGVPILEQRSSYVTWARVLSSEYEKLRKNVMKGYRTDIDEYGATDPAEFFAVATETFFEKPKQMKKKHSDLYQELKSYYQQDPAKWHKSRQGDGVH